MSSLWDGVRTGYGNLRTSSPGRVIETLALDVRDRDCVLTAFGALEERYSASDTEPLVVLVNSAGLALGLEPAQECSLEDWETMVDTNVKGLMFCTRALLPGMVRRGFGHVVNIGSIAGSYAYPGGNVYGASKSFVLQFSRGLRCDLHGTGVRVTNIEPGLLETEFSSVRFKGDEERAASVYRGTKPLTASDIADIIWWVVATPAHVDITQVEVMAHDAVSGRNPSLQGRGLTQSAGHPGIASALRVRRAGLRNPFVRRDALTGMSPARYGLSKVIMKEEAGASFADAPVFE